MDQVLAVSFSPFESHQFVTCGKQHVSFWELEENKLKQARGRMSVSQLLNSMIFPLMKPWYTRGLTILVWRSSSGNISKDVFSGVLLVPFWRRMHVPLCLTICLLVFLILDLFIYRYICHCRSILQPANIFHVSAILHFIRRQCFLAFELLRLANYKKGWKDSSNYSK